MGLTIHYTIEFKGTAKQLQKKLEKVRQACRDLPFEEVGEKVETVNYKSTYRPLGLLSAIVF